MVMKSKLLKTAFMEIIDRKKIFLSILFMSLLGVGFYSGITASAPNMKKTANSYYIDQNLYDIEIISPTGLTNEDIEKYKEIDNVKLIEPNISYDKLVNYKDKVFATKIYRQTTDINKLKINDGRLPKDENECVIDSKILKENKDFKIGDYIEIEDNENLLKVKKLKVVGLVSSPLYISDARENTNLLSGTIDYFIYLPKENFNYDIYTSLYLDVDTKEEAYTKEYDKIIEKTEKEIEKIDDKSYILNRNTNISYVSYKQDTERLDNIAKVFPIIFFVVATLISLTSMTRMVEEQRVEIGTLKALGYNRIQISIKYVLYASIATIIGGLLGIIIGILLLPTIVHMLYKTMYVTKDLIIDFNWDLSLLGLVVSYLCIISATLFAVEKELINNPAVLMRPKSPKNGQRVFIEKIPFIWNKFSFTTKVTIRNMFRYKKKFLMTIIGIAGCTGLIFAGFAIKCAVANLLPSQYGNVFNYQLEVVLKNDTENNVIEEVIKDKDIKDFLKIKKEYAKVSNKDKTNNETQIIVTNEDIDKFISINDYKNKQRLEVNNGVIITEKLATILKLKKGDIITIENSNKEKIDIQITGIAENYLQHYIYMSSDTYKENFSKLEYNTVLLNTKNKNIDMKEVSKELLKSNIFSKVIITEDIENAMNDTMENMNYVVWILIISAGILAFCVLYNLSNVNISERIRELATIKVLGFYDKEVHNYVEKETTFLTVIGIILGILFGRYLSIMIIRTCELETMLMPKNFSIDCYIYSVIITIIFTYIVSIFCYFNLKKINMIESLKSVE